MKCPKCYGKVTNILWGTIIGCVGCGFTWDKKTGKPPEFFTCSSAGEFPGSVKLKAAVGRCDGYLLVDPAGSVLRVPGFPKFSSEHQPDWARWMVKLIEGKCEVRPYGVLHDTQTEFVAEEPEDGTNEG